MPSFEKSDVRTKRKRFENSMAVPWIVRTEAAVPLLRRCLECEVGRVHEELIVELGN
jgi:hypothetical protein